MRLYSAEFRRLEAFLEALWIKMFVVFRGDLESFESFESFENCLWWSDAIEYLPWLIICSSNGTLNWSLVSRMFKSLLLRGLEYLL